MSRKPDPRPERTKRQLFDALIELMQEKRWDKIRVQDVLDRTGIGRSTFYAHFENKYALLTGAMPHNLNIVGPTGELDFMPLFLHVQEIQPVLLPIMSQPLLGEVSESFQRLLTLAWRDYLAGTELKPDRTEFVADFLAGAFMGIMLRWLTAGCDRPADVVFVEHQKYIDAVLAESVRS